MDANVLRQHYLHFMECDHEGKRDKPHCACSLLDLGWHPNVGTAVEAWISHVMQMASTPQSAGGETFAPCSKCGKTPPFPGGTRCQDLQCPLVDWAVGPTLTQRLRALYLCTENVADAETLKEAIERISTQSATRRIVAMPFLKAIKDQRDEAADVLRRLMHKLREESGSTDPMEPFAYDASWEALAKEADAILAKCPSYTQQLRNIAEGIGMTYEELVEGIKRNTVGPTGVKP